MIETLRSMQLPALAGTPKQVAFADKIRRAWLDEQLKVLEQNLRIVAGKGVVGTDLVEGTDPGDEWLRDGFVGIVAKQEKTIRADMARTSAKLWIESTEGQWVLKHGPMARKAVR